jgi:transcriptional regulator with XRE-family HTH domain
MSIMSALMSDLSTVQFSQRVGRVIRELRHHRGWSQQELADRLGYERSRIARLELGQVAINVDMLLLIANALEVDLFRLLPIEVKVKIDKNPPEAANDYQSGQKRL